MPREKDPMLDIFRRMGEPSWMILRVLEPVEGIPGVEIIKRVEDWLIEADQPEKSLDPSTLHRALRRMEADGLVECKGQKEVDLPGPKGSTYRGVRPVYVITAAGVAVLHRRQQLELAAQRRGLLPRFHTVHP